MTTIHKVKTSMFITFALVSFAAHAQVLGPTYIRHDAREHIRRERPEGYGPISVASQVAPLDYNTPPSPLSVDPELPPFTPALGGHAAPEVWCDNVARDLERVLFFASREESIGNYHEAQRILVGGLTSANANPYLRKGPITAKAIMRALTLTHVIEQSLAGQSNAPRAVVNFLGQYYRFILNVAKNLDRPFYIPSLERHEHGFGHDAAHFEENYIQFARDEVEIILDTLTIEGDNQVYPVGSTGAFLNALIESMTYASADLQDSPFVNRYSCTIAYFNQLIHVLQTNPVGSEPDLVNYAYSEARSLTDEIQTGCGYWK